MSYSRITLIFSLLTATILQARDITVTTQRGDISLTPLSNNAVRVRIGDGNASQTPAPDDIYLPGAGDGVDFQQADSGQYTLIILPDAKVRVDRQTGTLAFCDNSGRVCLRQLTHSLDACAAGSALSVQGEATHIASATFDSPADESLFGLGQFQDGYLNVRGLSRRLTQVNTQIAMPMVLSSRGYSLLWNNYGLTDFNPATHSVSLLRPTEGEGQVTEVDVTTTEGTRRERRLESHYVATIRVDQEGDYAFLLDVGQSMARRHKLSIDDQEIFNIQNVWLPPTMSVISHLTAGEHTLTAELTSNDHPTVYYRRVDATTTFRSPVADAVDYTVFVGSADQCIASYRQLSGQSPMLPLWAFGYVHCRERFHSSNEILQTARTFRQKQLPMDVMVQDWQWWGKYGWNAMRFDEEYYPDPKLLVDSLHLMGSRLMLSVWSKIDPNSPVGKEAESRGYYIPGTTWIDFFNPEASQYYWENFSDRLLKPYGIDCWWQDATEPENDDLVGRRVNGGKVAGERFRCLYPNLVSRTVYEGSRRDAPDHRTLILTRSGFPGIQRYGSFLWSGDVGNDWQTLRIQLAAGLNLMAAGHPWWTYDAGGFFRPQGQYDDKAFHERFLRWLQLATFLPMMRVHGYMTDTEFWRFGQEVERLSRRQLELRYSMLSYNYSLAYDVTQGGTMMRPLVMDYADDKEALAITDEYMFGPSLLVCPIMEPGVTDKDLYLPYTAGGWYDLDNNRHVAANGARITYPVSLEGIPVFVRAGSILPRNEGLQTTANASFAQLGITVYPGADGAFTLYEDEGTNYAYEQGQRSLIPMTWDDATRTLTIGQRDGSFPGMASTRTFLVSLPNGHAKKVTYKGKTLKVKL